MAESIVIGGPYETPKKPFQIAKRGKPIWYSRTWRAPFVSGVNEEWAKRCREYWDRVERRFGVIMSGHRNAFDPQTCTITTYAVCIAILKGDRYPARQSEAVH